MSIFFIPLVLQDKQTFDAQYYHRFFEVILCQT